MLPSRLGGQPSLPGGSHHLLVSIGILPEGCPPMSSLPPQGHNKLVLISPCGTSATAKLTSLPKIHLGKSILCHPFLLSCFRFEISFKCFSKTFLLFLFLFYSICGSKFYSYYGLSRRAAHPFEEC